MANMSVCIAYPRVYEIVQISELGSAETLFFLKNSFTGGRFHP